MKHAITLLAFLGIMLSATSHAQPVDICDRTPAVRDALLAALSASDCAAVDAESLARLRSLDLRERQLVAIKAGDFDGLSGLWQLDLYNNQLTSLPEDIFNGLAELRRLYLSANRLTSLPANVFDGLTLLQDLGLYNNRLTSLPAGLFDDLDSLSEVNLGANHLVGLSVDDPVFDAVRDTATILLANQTEPDDSDDSDDSDDGTSVDDHGDTIDDATELAVNGSQTGIIDPVGDVDYFRILVSENGTLAVYTTGTTDTVGTLFDGKGGQIATNDDAVEGVVGEHNFRIELEVDAVTYLVRVEASTGDEGRYTVHADFTRSGGGEDPSPTINICDRTPKVRDALLAALSASDCATVNAENLAGLSSLDLSGQQLVEIKAGDFHGLTNLRTLTLRNNSLKSLPVDVFDGLGGRLWQLDLYNNQLTSLVEGVFDGLADLRRLYLSGNHLTSLPADVFDGLTRLEDLGLYNNRLTSLPAGLFDDLVSLREVNLGANHLVGLSVDDPVFDAVRHRAEILLANQTDAPGVRRAAIPLLQAASSAGRQSFVRIINDSNESGALRISAYDDAGNMAGPLEIPLMANQAIHLSSYDLESGNSAKGIESGIGGPMQGNWRLAVEAGFRFTALAYVRTSDGFLGAIHDVLPRDTEGRLVARTFNPASNVDRQSRLRLINTGEGEEGVSIAGVDDEGNRATVTLTLSAGQSRTFTAMDLEEGAMGLTGTLGDGVGKWRLFITAADPVVGMSLIYSVSGHVTNLSTAGDQAW